MVLLVQTLLCSLRITGSSTAKATILGGAGADTLGSLLASTLHLSDLVVLVQTASTPPDLQV